jgi:hypothetical protein
VCAGSFEGKIQVNKSAINQVIAACAGWVLWRLWEKVNRSEAGEGQDGDDHVTLGCVQGAFKVGLGFSHVHS